MSLTKIVKYAIIYNRVSGTTCTFPIPFYRDQYITWPIHGLNPPFIEGNSKEED
jgi:hypothetical protein